jgi:hypothetical protein
MESNATADEKLKGENLKVIAEELVKADVYLCCKGDKNCMPSPQAVAFLLWAFLFIQESPIRSIEFVIMLLGAS